MVRLLVLSSVRLNLASYLGLCIYTDQRLSVPSEARNLTFGQSGDLVSNVLTKLRASSESNFSPLFVFSAGERADHSPSPKPNATKAIYQTIAERL